ncbi:hypothetical protein DIURU_001577 [Diutina rugosa]|uniref:Genetic interactor of prohibitin 5, mitochondrial n=1 Tax=Diutina rugosa TaxID=5481 RepID=A0A642UY70_DIURU|nr:uncharacterized protein DIURU_001577 [Diutina rugosa]KAA8905149.1 hypothetical protein DIURU_001577 [Diutina rugosa]
MPTTFKQAVTAIRRLPVDTVTLNRIVASVKSQVKQARNPQDLPRLYRSWISLQRQLVEDERWSSLSDVLDRCYKRPPQWYHQFRSVSPVQLKPFWPQVHLIDEFGTEPALRKYHEAQALIGASNTSWLRQGPGESPFTMLRKYGSGVSLYEQLTDKAVKLTRFVSHNQSRLAAKRNIKPEVSYPTDQYALPLSAKRQNNIFVKKIREVKQLVTQFVPLAKYDLDWLITVASTPLESSEVAINPNFFRYMERKREIEKEQLSPKLRAKRTKWWIPTEHNIRKHYRSYVTRQFFIDDSGNYQLSPMDNFFHNQKPLTEALHEDQ